MATVAERIREYIASSSDAAFLTSEFLQFGSRSVVARALRKLVEDQTLYRAGYGVYTPRRRQSPRSSSLTWVVETGLALLTKV